MRLCVFGMRYDISVLVGMYLSNNALKVVGGRACRTGGSGLVVGLVGLAGQGWWSGL